MSQSRPFVIFYKVKGGWIKDNSRFGSVDSAAKRAQQLLDHGIVNDARVMEKRADGVWQRRWPPIEPIITPKKGN